MARRRADLVLVFRAVDVNETIARVRIVVVRAVEPENSRHHQVFGGWQRIFRAERDTAAENCSAWHIAADLFRDAKVADRRFEAAFLSSDAEPRAGNWKRANRFAVASQRQPLILNGNVDLGSWTWPRRS